MVRILHTADWHLGQRFLSESREEEFAQFLDWLRESVIIPQKVQVLVIAGDVFDVGTPPNTATKLYYDFLGSLQRTTCQDVVVVGGNHDSALLLNSTAEVLKYLNVHVRGHASTNPKDDLIVLKNPQNEPFLVICAVPFLRSRDLSLSDEVLEEEAYRKTLRQRIKAHYTRLAELAQPYREKAIPVLTTGHLWATGAEFSNLDEQRDDAERSIYMGHLADVGLEAFGEGFDYVALGHIHKAQRVGGNEHIRYSGSPIPLNFSERNQEKQVLLVDLNANKPAKVEAIKVPLLRNLLRFEGTIKEIETALQKFQEDFKIQTPFQTWAEVILEVDGAGSAEKEALDKLIDTYKRSVRILYTKRKLKTKEINYDFSQDQYLDLNDRETVLLVFDKFCESKNITNENQLKTLKSTFREVLERLAQTDPA